MAANKKIFIGPGEGAHLPFLDIKSGRTRALARIFRISICRTGPNNSLLGSMR